MDKILTVKEVAEILKVKPITVREMFRANRLRAFKLGKAWRTTEKMLEEDVAALSQADPPAQEPAPTEKPRRRRKNPAPREASIPEPEAEAETAEDPQQFLF